PAKRSFGPWMLKGFRLLARFRRLRNTWLDPFARTHERKVERAWLESYEAILDEVLARFTTDNFAAAVELARLPDAVRGYGQVKERYLAHAEERKTRLLARLRGEAQFHDATQTTGMSAHIQ
ncbi:DUF6537 domain-containing protein, partial [Pseudomonas aeruginosa]|uniref:DUF6537 domain-containing protein n=2 Tax=Pseudomonas TaxID=286 RepID=UPI00396F6A62